MKKVLIALVIVTLALGLGFLIKKLVFDKHDSWFKGLFQKKEITIELGSNIVEEIKNIAQLATSSYFEEFLYEDQQYEPKEKPYYPESINSIQKLYTKPQGVQVEFEPTDKIVFIIKGTCIAGFDLSRICPDDIQPHGDTVTIILPDPEILDVIVNPEDYEIFDSSKKVSDESINSALITARKNIERDAINHGLLKDALENGKRQIDTFLRFCGYKTIIIRSRTEVYEQNQGLTIPLPVE